MAYYFITDETNNLHDHGYYYNSTNNDVNVLILVDMNGVIKDTIELDLGGILNNNETILDLYTGNITNLELNYVNTNEVCNNLVYDNPKEQSFKDKLLDKVDFINKMSI